MAESAGAWRAQAASVSTPDAEHEWFAIRRRIRSGEKPQSVPLAWLRPAGFGLAAAAAVALAVMLAPRSQKSESSTPGRDSTYVSYVTVESASDSTMVYEDPDSGWLVVWVGDAKQTSGS